MADELQSRLDFMGLGPEQRERLNKVKDLIGRLVPPALERFYEQVRRTPETARFFRDDGHMSKAQSAQERHWNRIAQGTFDADFLQSVRRIGSVHARIGLEPRWYIGAYGLVIEHVLQGLAAEHTFWKRLKRGFAGPSQAEVTIAFVKAALLDMELSVSIYFEQSQVERDQAIERLNGALASLARGDLSSRVSELPGSFSAIQENFNSTLDQLRTLIGGVINGTGRIEHGSSEIAQAAEDLARRTESTAASLEQTSAAVSQINDRIQTTSQAAEQTLESADQTIAAVDSGRKVASVAVSTMKMVSDSAQGIDAVIEGLDKIAFQTRVLAMNAAVEAGRAGEAGRGFAVVADLVSALAMRAEEEAKKARGELTGTQEVIASAVGAVEKVDVELQKIALNVGEVHELLGGIARDNQAQALAISEISSAVQLMDRSTQQNAAMVEETSAAARSLAAEVGRLNEETGRFSTGEDGARKLIAEVTARFGQAA